MTRDTIHPTRYQELGYVHDGPGLWRIVDLTGELHEPYARVGPHYRTKAELLADLARYARDCWGL